MVPDPWTIEEIEALLANGAVDDLVIIPIAITNLGTPDAKWSEEICLRLATHANVGVRGNAVLGLGHLARTAGTLHHDRSLAVISTALRDSDPYVRGHAESAADDVQHCLGWSVDR